MTIELDFSNFLEAFHHTPAHLGRENERERAAAQELE